MAAHQVNITDRAERYRAQNNVTGPKKCVLCGTRKDIGVMHLTGNESHGEPANLAYGCRSCNANLAVAFKKVGAGRPTNQYNPSSGVPSFEQYMWAVSNHSRGAHDAGGAVIHATPKHKRIEYARRIVSKAQQTKRDKADDRWNPATQRNRSLKEVLFGKPYKPVDVGSSYYTPPARASKRAVSRKRADDLNAEYLKTLKPAKSATFKGRAIKQVESGSWVVPSIDKESEFDTLQDAKAFITSWKRNPGPPVIWVTPSTRRKGHWTYGQVGYPVNAMKTKAGAIRRAEAIAKETGGQIRVKDNPASASAEVFEDFHGFAPSEVVTVTKRIHYHAQLAAAGKLTHLDVWGIDNKGHRIEGFKGAFLAFNETKDQLFVEGGDQAINLDDFGIRSPHELETLGELTDIGYQTNKTHLGDEGGEAVYVHKFRTTNDNGKHVTVRIARYPDLIYDVRNEQLLFSGGSYEILREGINK